MALIDELRRMVSPVPATRKKLFLKPIVKMPLARKRVCIKCPFGGVLDKYEQAQADALKESLKDRPEVVWGCHETAGHSDTVGDQTLLCPGWMKWKQEQEAEHEAEG